MKSNLFEDLVPYDLRKKAAQQEIDEEELRSRNARAVLKKHRKR